MAVPSSSDSSAALPRHIAIIMDGNGRWAEKRGLPRAAGHRAGVKSVRSTIEYCARKGIEALTLFAFSSENWNRPKEEVGLLMSLFLEALDREVADLDKNNIRIRFVGELSQLATELQTRIRNAAERTAHNTRLTVVVAVAYGGRWDIAQAARSLAADCVSGKIATDDITEAMLTERMVLAGIPDPDLFIRTGGDHRISNFLLWNIAYTELCFLPEPWPEFGDAQLDAALELFAQRERRFGLTSAQITQPAAKAETAGGKK
jgi:undecaprenyl diphosphate synthase